MSARPRVSVVVAVRDEAGRLGALLDALAAQTARGAEVVVADDGSRDGSPEVARARAGVRVVVGERGSSYAARNRGAAAAGAAVLAFTDADCRPAPSWLERGLGVLERGEADLVAGHVRFAPTQDPGPWGLVDVDLYLDQRRAVAAGRAATANLLVDRAWFEHVGGFDAGLASSGDHDLVQRCVAAGARLAYAPDAVVAHPVRDDARALLVKHWRTHAARAERDVRRGERSPRRRRVLLGGPQVARARRAADRPLRLDRERLADAGLAPGPLAEAQALVALYGVLPVVALAADVAGARRGRARRP